MRFHADFLSRAQRAFALGAPLSRIAAVSIVIEIGSAFRVVHERNLAHRHRRIVVDEMIPAMGQFADQGIIAKPFELMEFKAGGRVERCTRDVGARHFAVLLKRITLDQFFFSYLL